MFEIVFLGTSASAPTIERGLSSAIVLHREYRFMIDCGEGTQRQLLSSGLGFKRLDKILLTHGHLDHILGLGGLISTLGRWEMIPDIDIFAGRWPLQRIEELMNVVFGTVDNLPVKVNLHAIEPGVLFTDDKFELRAVPVSHRGPGCFGFIFEERQKRPFLVEKAEALGVPPGPIRRELVQGNTVTLADGRMIQSEDILGPAMAGAKLAVIGDAGRTENLVDEVAGAGALVIEFDLSRRRCRDGAQVRAFDSRVRRAVGPGRGRQQPDPEPRFAPLLPSPDSGRGACCVRAGFCGQRFRPLPGHQERAS